MTGASWRISRKPPCGSTAASRGGWSKASPPSRLGATAFSRRRSSAAHKLDRQIVREEHWLRYGVSARRKRNQRRLEGLLSLRGERTQAKRNRVQADVRLEVQEAGETGRKVIEARGISKSYGDLHLVRDFGIKIARGDRIGIRRAERCRQDDAHQHADRRACARRGPGEARHQSRSGDAGSAPRTARPRTQRRGHPDRRQRRHGDHQRRGRATSSAT